MRLPQRQVYVRFLRKRTQDTARALREAQRAGVSTFCVTIDPAGHDYLRRMCTPEGYRVIDDVHALPQALSEIYARLTGRA